MKIDIGIEAGKREEIARGLSCVLADTYTLYLETHNFHWNVTGPMFQTLHIMFETQYTELALAVDLVAERIPALGFPAPGSYRQFAELSAIKDVDGVPRAQDMIRLLVEGHETVARTAREVFRSAEGVSDQPTCDLLTQRMQVHEKTAWMLRSLLGRVIHETRNRRTQHVTPNRRSFRPCRLHRDFVVRWRSLRHHAGAGRHGSADRTRGA
ncbi:MAG TPA: Dps family protein [Polyangiaceae bacterium]|nr:Dps family protein [Polyangiaceae bacterium]